MITDRTYNRFFVTFLFLGALLMISSCSTEEKFDEEVWRSEVESWHSERIDELQQYDGWLSLAGFFWLKEGRESFGGSSDSDHHFDLEREIPGRLGWLEVDEEFVYLEADPDVELLADGEPVESRTLVFSPEMEDPVEMEWGDYYWYIIERSGEYAIRLRDKQHPRIAAFEGIDRYPVSADWRVTAEFKPFDEPVILTIPNYIGEPSQESILGVLEFDIGGDTHHLYPVADNLEERFFLIFADQTNGSTTYSAGRFVYTDPPDENNRVIIDFNRSYNPPCVFSEYATCPLPPPENRLPVKITAGEFDYEPVL